MKKKIFGGIAIVAMAVAVAMNVTVGDQKQEKRSLLALANVEALAEGEYELVNNRTPAKCKTTTTIETYTTTEPGWVWSLELNVWLFKGKVSHESPKDYLKTTKTTIAEFDGCVLGGDSDCTGPLC